MKKGINVFSDDDRFEVLKGDTTWRKDSSNTKKNAKSEAADADCTAHNMKVPIFSLQSYTPWQWLALDNVILCIGKSLRTIQNDVN